MVSTGERGNGDGGDDAQWIRVEPPAVVFGATVLRQQARQAFVGRGNNSGNARVSTV